MEFRYLPSFFAKLVIYRHCQGHNSWSSTHAEEIFANNVEILLIMECSPLRSLRRQWLQTEAIVLLALYLEYGLEEGSWAVSSLNRGEDAIQLNPIV